jgi:hypothetical protein
MALKVRPPSVLTCHWTVGVGLPTAAAVNVAIAPATTLTLVGFCVTDNVVTVSVAAVVVAEPLELVKTARNRFPSYTGAAVKLNWVEVMPWIGLKVAPPSVLRSHWSVGVGVPDACTVKVAVAPERWQWPQKGRRRWSGSA